MKKMITTPSFTVATYTKGFENASKLAIVIPGRLDTKDYVHMTTMVDHLADLGFLALSFDPPGTWESPGEIDIYTTTNIMKLIDELIDMYGKPTVLVGHSRGGSHAMISGTTNPRVMKFVSIMSHHGPTTLGWPSSQNKTSHSTRDLPPGTSRTSARKAFDLPYEYFEDQTKYDALEDLKNCEKPKLFVYGTQDELVTKDDVVATYKASSGPKDLLEVESEHDYRLHANIVKQINEYVGKFLTRDEYEVA